MAPDTQTNLSPELLQLVSRPELSVDQSWQIFKEIFINNDVDKSLLELLYASTTKDDEAWEDTPTGPRRRPIVRIARLPDEKRICPKCKIIKDDYKWEYCQPREETLTELRFKNIELDGINKKENTGPLSLIDKLQKEGIEKRIVELGSRKILHEEPIQTEWLDWDPPIKSSTGFTEVKNFVMTNIGKIYRSANLDKKDTIAKYALGIAGDVDEMIFEHPLWQGKNKLTRSQRVALESTIAKNIQSVLSSSLGALLLERITQSTQVRELTTRGLGTKTPEEKGFFNKMGQWLSS